ncbi:MAG TPA: glycine betaine ABC transporter substrate-binding protein [Candidatus Acidoferrales bacterium]|nr:glycine betaine ABC transporter substrate-binding protein [Candidatus Acidoferrales bacterium]
MRRKFIAGIAVAITAVLAACGGGNSGGSSPTASGTKSNCPAPSGSSGNGATVSIGSKSFAEEQLLAQMTKDVLEAHGFTVTYTFQAADKAIGTALVNGTIDMYWQYTGTELGDYLGLQTGSYPTALDAAFTFVQKADEPHGLCWVAPTQFDDTNGIAIKQSNAGTFGSSLAAFGTYLTSHPSAKVCIQSEFLTRPDGLPGLVSTYGWPAASAFHYQQIGTTAEKAIASGQCDAGEVYTTDSGIAANNEVTLTDDKNLFPPDNAGLIVKDTVLQQHPAIAALMIPVAAKLTTTVMLQLNAMVEIQNMTVADVAHTWLVQNGFLSS